MPVLKSAKKALRVSKRRKGENERIQKNLGAVIKAFRVNPTLTGLVKAYSAIDRAAKNHIIHKNKASRLKGSLAKLVKTAKAIKKTKKKSVKTKKSM